MGVQGTLVNARTARDRGMEAAVEHLRELLPVIMNSEDAAEGVTSFLERRAGNYTGR